MENPDPCRSRANPNRETRLVRSSSITAGGRDGADGSEVSPRLAERIEGARVCRRGRRLSVYWGCSCLFRRDQKLIWMKQRTTQVEVQLRTAKRLEENEATQKGQTNQLTKRPESRSGIIASKCSSSTASFGSRLKLKPPLSPVVVCKYLKRPDRGLGMAKPNELDAEIERLLVESSCRPRSACACDDI